MNHRSRNNSGNLPLMQSVPLSPRLSRFGGSRDLGAKKSEDEKSLSSQVSRRSYFLRMPNLRAVTRTNGEKNSSRMRGSSLYVSRSSVGPQDCSENCSFMLEDQKIQSLFSRTASFDFKSDVEVKTTKSFKLPSSGILVLKNGSLTFSKSYAAHASAVFPLHNIVGLEYSGQQNSSFAFTAFPEKTGVKTSGRVLLVSKPVRVEVICKDNHTAKRWMQIILLDIERIGDMIADCLEHLLKTFQKDNLLDINIIHVTCLLKKRVGLYELCKLVNSTKLINAKFNLANHYQQKGEYMDSRPLFDELKITQEIREMREEQSLSQIVKSGVAVDDFTILKQELKLIVNELEKNASPDNVF